MLNGLQIGRIVHYVLGANDVSNPKFVGRHVAGIVVNACPKLGREDGYANLTIFPDWSNDGFEDFSKGAMPVAVGIAWKTSVSYSEDKEPGTWHWPEREETPSESLNEIDRIIADGEAE